MIITLAENISLVSEEFLSEEICIIAVKQHIDALKLIDKKYHSTNIYKEALLTNPHSFKCFTFQNEELCMLAVKGYCGNIQYIEEQSDAVCEYVIKNCSSMYFSLFIKNKTKKMYQLAVEQMKIHLGEVPFDFLTYDMCVSAIKNNGLELQYVTPDIITYDLCVSAIKNNGLALRYVPDIYRTYEIQIMAVKQNPDCLSMIPWCDRTYELCIIAGEKGNLKDAPCEFITHGMCKKTVEDNGTIKYMF